MGDYLRSIALYMAMFFMVFALAGYIGYYANVSNLKQDTYKEFMYTALNKGTVRLNGADDLYNGDVAAYYLDDEGSYKQMNYEIAKQISIASKKQGKVDYELIYNNATNQYFIHLQAGEVDTVIKFILEKGDV